MFALVFPSGKQFTLTAVEVARIVADDAVQVKHVRMTEAGAVIRAALHGANGAQGFVITAPYPNGLDMIYQAGGPQL